MRSPYCGPLIWILLSAGCGADIPGAPADAAAPIDVAAPVDAAARAVDAAPAVDAPPPVPVSPDLVREVMGRIKVDDVRARYAELAAVSVPDRRTRTSNYDRAAEWARALVAAAAPAAAVRIADMGGYRNVEVIIKGADPAAGMYIVGGHLDSVRGTTAMDDNGSGSLGTALIAMALAQYQYGAEIRAVLFDAEEIGLLGSNAYARALLATCAPDSCLKTFINLDMIGYDPENRRRLRVRTELPEMQALFSRVNAEQMVGLTLAPSGGECHSSDDCSFSRAGYHAVYPLEGTITPHIHTPADTVDTLNFTTLTSTLQLVTGVLATAAGIRGRL